MIRKLRKKLILSAMLSLALVLTVNIAGLNFMNYRGIVADADSVLRLIDDRDLTRPPERSINWKKAAPRFKSPEMPFEIRFFSILLNRDNSVSDVSTDHIAAVDRETAEKYAAGILKSGKERGFADDYRYLVSETKNGTRITFLDCGRMLTSARMTLIYSLVVAAAGLAAVFVLILLFSRRIIRPFLDNYEKQKRFISDAGHEIKTPLTVINADAELIGMETGDSEWLRDIKAQSARLTELTGKLIRLARSEEPENAQMIEFPVSDLISETVASFRAPAQTQNKTVTTEIQPMLSLLGNESDIRQLAAVLLDNAIRYSPDGADIFVSLKKQNRQLLLICENPAENIPDGLTKNMFDRFYRGDASRSAERNGNGIGLSIAKAIVEAHRGKIRADIIDNSKVRITVMLQTTA